MAAGPDPEGGTVSDMAASELEAPGTTGDGPLAGRVAVITGGARGQGRSHAVGLARQGADIALVDRCADLPTVTYPMATADDLAETIRLVEAEGRRCVSAIADVRDLGAMIGFVDGVVADLGSVDILVANAGVSTLGSIVDMDAAQWSETVDVNLTGVFNAMRAVARHLRRNRWGRIIAISSMMGRSANPMIPAYCASKWGVIGLTKSVAYEMAHSGVTANAIAPGNISTDMIHNDTLYRLMRPDLEHPSREDVAIPMTSLHVQPVPWLEPDEVTAAVLFLCSEGARHITGSVIDVDAGASARFTA
jgi:SDR family mycofactocin-dependent oxidoreductase